MKKQELRKLFKQKRADLSEFQINKFQVNIYEQIREINFGNEQNIHIFLPIKRQKEVDTQPIINFLRKQNKTIIISKSDFKTNTLKHFVYEESTVLEINKWGIPEPVNATKINVKEIDLVFVPLLISDKKNYRVGYGKGFYDRFLSECKSSVKTIGLNFFHPIHEIKDVNQHDIALNKIIYPKKNKTINN